MLLILDAAYPREGTVTSVTMSFAMLLILDAAYPREGTVTRFEGDRLIECGCSLSPRGDGYYRGMVKQSAEIT